MKNKLNKKDVEKIKDLSEKLNVTELSKKFKVSLDTVRYHLSEEVRRKKKENKRRRYGNLTREQKKAIYQRNKDYRNEYKRRKYHSDSEYRLKEIERVRAYRLRRKPKKS